MHQFITCQKIKNFPTPQFIMINEKLRFNELSLLKIARLILDEERKLQ